MGLLVHTASSWFQGIRLRSNLSWLRGRNVGILSHLLVLRLPLGLILGRGSSVGRRRLTGGRVIELVGSILHISC